MSEHIHNIYFLANLFAILALDRSDEFRGKTFLRRLFDDPFNDAITALTEFLEDVVSIDERLRVLRTNRASFESCWKFYDGRTR